MQNVKTIIENPFWGRLINLAGMAIMFGIVWYFGVNNTLDKLQQTKLDRVQTENLIDTQIKQSLESILIKINNNTEDIGELKRKSELIQELKFNLKRFMQSQGVPYIERDRE